VGMDALVHQAGLPHPGFAHNGDDLPVASACLLERVARRELAPHACARALLARAAGRAAT